MKSDDLKKILIIGVIMVASGWVAWNYYDARYFINWAVVAQKYGILYLYQYSDKVAYMPLAPVFFVILYVVAKEGLSIASIIGLTYLLTPMDILRLMLKVPLILSSLAVGYYLYRREGWGVARFWFYGIPVWMVMWQYQFDPIMVMFTVIGAYCLLDGRISRSGLLLGIGASFKYVPFLMVPFILKGLREAREKVKFLASFSLPILLSTAPFLMVDISDAVKKTFGFHMERYPQMLSIFNIPYVISYYTLHGWDWINYLWLPLFAGTYLWLLWRMRVDLEDKDSLFAAFAAATLTFILFNKVSNPQYILWPYPFLVYFAHKWRIPRPNFKMALVAATLVALVLYPVLMFLPAAAVDRTVYAEEDASWVPARLMIIYSFDGRARFLISELIYVMEYFTWDLMCALYNNFNIIGASLIIVYNTLLAFILLSLMDVDVSRSVKRVMSVVSGKLKVEARG